MSEDSARLFLALWPGQVLRERLSAWARGCAWPAEARPVPASQWHLTLHFLGALPRAQLPALREALRVAFAPFTLALGRPALWRGGTAVLEVDAVPRLLALHAVLGQVLQAEGLRVEARPYRPHLTLARRAPQAMLPAAGPALRWPVRGWALVESGPQGYRVLQHYR